MFLTSSKLKSKAFLFVLCAVCAAGTHAAKPSRVNKPAEARPKGVEMVAPGALTVSERELNTFIFPGQVKRIFFPAGAAVTGEPIYLSGGTQVMLQFAKTNEESIQMVVELADGNVHTLRVQPRPVQGVVHSIAGAKPRKAVTTPLTADGPGKVDPRAEDIELLKRVVGGEVPDEFTPVDLPKPTRFDKFSVIPMSGWSDGGSKRIYVFQLVAQPGQTALVAAPQFYRNGITAVMLDGDVVDATTSPTLFVIEEAGDE